MVQKMDKISQPASFAGRSQAGIGKINEVLRPTVLESQREEAPNSEIASNMASMFCGGASGKP
jgi:hypothetical protein